MTDCKHEYINSDVCCDKCDYWENVEEALLKERKQTALAIFKELEELNNNEVLRPVNLEKWIAQKRKEIEQNANITL